MSISCEKRAKDRYANLDVIRIFSMILVVLCHCIDKTILDVEHTEKLLNFAISLQPLTKIAVPMFIMVTGFLFLPREWSRESIKKFYLKNVLHIVISFQIAIIINFLLKPSFLGGGYKDYYLLLIKELFFLTKTNGALYSSWYVYFVIGLYMILPILSVGIKKIPCYLILIIMLSIYYMYFINDIFEDFGIGYLLYLFLGYIIYVIDKKIQQILHQRQIVCLGFINLIFFQFFI